LYFIQIPQFNCDAAQAKVTSLLKREESGVSHHFNIARFSYIALQKCGSILNQVSVCFL